MARSAGSRPFRSLLCCPLHGYVRLGRQPPIRKRKLIPTFLGFAAGGDNGGSLIEEWCKNGRVLYEARKSGREDRIEVTMRRQRRRRWSTEEKLRIVRETLRPGAVASVVADQHGIGTGQLAGGRQRARACRPKGWCFDPRPRAGGDNKRDRAVLAVPVSIRAPVRGATHVMR